MKYPNHIIWRKQELEKSLQVACTVGPEPHILTIDSITMISINDTGPGLPYAFCPEHKAYYGISSDVDTSGMILKLDEGPLVGLEMEVEQPNENKNNSA